MERFDVNGCKGLPQSIINCIISTDVDIRKELLQSIVITGGLLYKS
ncbi:hypothetical protein PFTANZ_05187 [Plasmodium falciparum Tanzania (2000708)]|uniref:Uncharacterized protein n=1 Tax=Plasmodium falciparum Tanzania (2000708) TaxID=1036725 RepID=A0A024VZM3_PLAFA|nr:hypothetical protein PFTANZ_05187 [Plasmodium falciparum Tanzania (2000708)]